MQADDQLPDYPHTADNTGVKAADAATTGRIRQVVSNQEAAAVALAQEQLKESDRKLVAAKAQVKSSSAHAAALQQQLAQVGIAVSVCIMLPLSEGCLGLAAHFP